MCISCLAFSALSLFTPATEALPSIDVQRGTVREITFQADSLKVAQENQVAITMMLNQLPILLKCLSWKKNYSYYEYDWT